MIFNVERDEGSQIVGWLVNDRPDEIPRLKVFLDPGRTDPIVINADEVRDWILATGFHDTGQCGFTIDERIVPNIRTSTTLVICEHDTGTVIYKRGYRPGQHIAGRHFRLETRILPRSWIDTALQPYFHMFYPGFERYSAQTGKTILAIPYTVSLMASGRVPFHAVEDVLRQHRFKTSALIGDPYNEILGRVALILKGGQGQANLTAIAPPEVLSRIEAMLRNLSDRNVEAIDAALGRLDAEALHYLSDPLTRLLVDVEAGQALPRDALQEAMRRLATIDAIGLDHDPGEYVELIGALFGKPLAFNVKVGNGPDPELAERLRALPTFQRLTCFDGPLYDALNDAFAALPEFDEAANNPAPVLSFGGRKAARKAAARD